MGTTISQGILLKDLYTSTDPEFLTHVHKNRHLVETRAEVETVLALLRNPNTTPSVKLELINAFKNQLGKKVFRNLPVEALEILASSTNINTVISVLSYETVPVELVEKLSTHPRDKVKIAVAGSVHTPGRVLVKMFTQPCAVEKIKEAIAVNRNTPKPFLIKLVKENDKVALHTVFNNPQWGINELKTFAETPQYQQFLARVRDLPEEVIETLIEQNAHGDLVTSQLSRYTNLTPRLVEKLWEDSITNWKQNPLFYTKNNFFRLGSSPIAPLRVKIGSALYGILPRGPQYYPIIGFNEPAGTAGRKWREHLTQFLTEEGYQVEDTIPLEWLEELAKTFFPTLFDEK